MQGLIGKKVGMTRIFNDEGREIAVTVIKAGANIVHQIKTLEKDGYVGVQLGYEEVSVGKINKPLNGHFKKNGSAPTRKIKEFKVDDSDVDLKPGQKIGVEILENVKFVDVVGKSKGRGHAGTIKRHNFTRGRKTHGNTNLREHGSIGQCSYPARVYPGLSMSGHYGSKQVTMKRLKLVGIDKESGLIYVKGNVPGCAKSIVYIKKNESR